MKRLNFQIFNRRSEGESIKSRFRNLDFETKIILSVFIGSILFIGVGVATALEPNESPGLSIHIEKETIEVEVPLSEEDPADNEGIGEKVKDQEEPELEEEIIVNESEDEEIAGESVEGVSPGTNKTIRRESISQGDSAKGRSNESSITRPAEKSNQSTTNKTTKKPQIEHEGKTEESSVNNEKAKGESSEIAPQPTKKPEVVKESGEEQMEVETEKQTEPETNEETQENRDEGMKEQPTDSERHEETSTNSNP